MATAKVFDLPLRVRPEDIDRNGHVNNVVYLRYAQDAAVAHWRSAASAEQQAASAWVARRHEIDYLRPGFEGDELIARTWVGEASGATFDRFVEIVRSKNGETLAKVRTVWVLLDPQRLRPRRVDAAIRAPFFAAARAGGGAPDGPSLASAAKFPVRPVAYADAAEWRRMRALLWPETPAEEHEAEIARALRVGAESGVFVAERPGGGLCGFVEASIRHEADWCGPGPAGYVEGWYVDADRRRRGVGRDLVGAAEGWAAARGCRVMGSDAHTSNRASRRAHAALGFREVERVALFSKPLGSSDSA